MTTYTTVRHSRQYSLTTGMDSPADKEERKREYNRLAQREFRRRRKEHLKSLEQAQKEQSSEQSEEIERLRYQNDELRRENEALRAQIYGSSSSSSLMAAPISVPLANDGRQYSLSPSISGTSISGAGSPPATMGSDLMPLSALSLSSSMLPPSMHAYADPSALSTQPYMVHSSGLRHNVQSSPESSGYRRPTVGPPFQSLNVSQPAEAHSLQVPGPRRSSTQPSGPTLTPPIQFDRSKARNDLRERFRLLLSDPAIIATSDRHLATLRSMSDILPNTLKPTKAQLDTPHYYGIDLIASPSLRDRLLTVTSDVAQSFLTEIGIHGNDREDLSQLVIWGSDPLDETSWEFSQAVLERWGWMLGRDWVARANFWRRSRGAALLPDW